MYRNPQPQQREGRPPPQKHQVSDHAGLHQLPHRIHRRRQHRWHGRPH